jgi:hypothetical protein
MEDKKIILQEIAESNAITKNTLNIILLIGSLGFLIVGISSYLKVDLISFLQAQRILFFPQGLVMSLYGLIGTILSINQIIISYFKVGNGYNEFNKEKGNLKIFRKSFPINNEDINITIKLEDIVRSVKFRIKL